MSSSSAAPHWSVGRVDELSLSDVWGSAWTSIFFVLEVSLRSETPLGVGRLRDGTPSIAVGD